MCLKSNHSSTISLAFARHASTDPSVVLAKYICVQKHDYLRPILVVDVSDFHACQFTYVRYYVIWLSPLK